VDVDEQRRAVEEAADFLREILVDGEKPAKEVIREAKKAGISETTLKRARKGVVHPHKAKVLGGKRGEAPWVWTLVEGQEAHDPSQTSNDLLYPSEKEPKNQEFTDKIKEVHVATFNGI
jgi:hypothetical protein